MKNYSGRYPFKLATTSYIYPDKIVPNVTLLAPLLDEIELVLFQSEDLGNIPDDSEIRDLLALSKIHGIGFNVHLPIDIFLGDERDEIRLRGVSVVKRVIQRTLSLLPSTYTLHLDLRNKEGQEETDIKSWQQRIVLSIEEIVSDEIHPEKISIETLGYPFEWAEEIISKFGVSVCLDLGHILLYKQDLQGYMDKYLSKTSIVHFHGHQNGIDHLGIDKLDGKTIDLILSHLQNYTGVLSIEVFSQKDLMDSIKTLEERWKRRG